MILPSSQSTPPQHHLQTDIMSAPNNMNQIKPIAPKPNNNSTKSEAVSTTTSGRQTPACRRKQMAFQHPTFGYAIPAPLPAKVARRNARERNR